MRLIDADDFIARTRELYNQAGWGFRDIHYSQSDVEFNLSMMPTIGEWVPIKLRPMTEEEKEAWAEYGDFNEIFDCPMPADGQLIWVTSKCGNLWQDTCEDDGGLLSLEGNSDWDDIVAWMPLPEPYTEKK